MAGAVVCAAATAGRRGLVVVPRAQVRPPRRRAFRRVRRLPQGSPALPMAGGAALAAGSADAGCSGPGHGSGSAGRPSFRRLRRHCPPRMRGLHRSPPAHLRSPSHPRPLRRDVACADDGGGADDAAAAPPMERRMGRTGRRRATRARHRYPHQARCRVPGWRGPPPGSTRWNRVRSGPGPQLATAILPLAGNQGKRRCGLGRRTRCVSFPQKGNERAAGDAGGVDPAISVAAQKGHYARNRPAKRPAPRRTADSGHRPRRKSARHRGQPE